MSTYLLALAGLLLGVLLVRLLALRATSSRARAPYPPGPKPKPIIGNALDFPTPSDKAHEVYMRWGEECQSNIVFASAFGQNVLILNKWEDADELLDRRARLCTDRPIIPILSLMGWEWNMPLYQYGKKWRFHRQICQQNFRAEAARSYHPLLLRKTHDMCNRILHDPDNFSRHNKMLSISIPMASMYGYDVKNFEDPCITAAEEGTALGATLLYPGATWVNVFPILAKLPIPTWLPGTSTWRVCERVKELAKVAENIPFEFVKKGMEDGTATDSFMMRFLQKKEHYGASAEEEEAVRNIATTVYSAASDTTISLTYSFYYLMAVHPEIQRKAQEEIDRVIGSTRLPNLDDRPALPYIEAIYRELLRFAPPLPIALPHGATEDDHYKGYFIPKGTIVFGNVWAMTRDEDMYPEPSLFKPERFLEQNGCINDDKHILAYGFGRRICVGKHIASATMWIVIASVLACFKIEKKKDKFGNDVGMNHDFIDNGPTRHKGEYHCSFVPRMPFIKQLLEEVMN